MSIERQKIRNGKFTLRCVEQVTRSDLSSRDSTLIRSGTTFWDMEFNLERDQFVLDRIEPFNRDLWAGDLKRVDATNHRESVRKFLCQTIDKLYVYSDLYKDNVGLESFDRAKLKRRVKDYVSFDVRAFGFGGVSWKRTDLGDTQFFENMMTRNGASIRLDQPDNDVFKLYYEASLKELGQDVNDDNWRSVSEMWVDASKGHTPFVKRIVTNGEVVLESTSDWTFKGDTWVPLTYSAFTINNVLHEKHKGQFPTRDNFDQFTFEQERTDVSITFEWHYVNRDGLGDDIDFKAFDPPPGTFYYDNGVLKHIYGRELPERFANRTQPSRRNGYLFFGIPLLAVIVFLVLVFRKR
ncbi:hypothetical protein SH449x_002508 [Pirellulaceae bacterium SH449]